MKLTEKINLMKECYFKGFVGQMEGVRSNTEAYVYYPDVRDECKKDALKHLENIENTYKSLPFERLDLDFAPLFAIKRLIPVYAEKVRRLLDEPTKDLADEVRSIGGCITEAGKIYRANFKKRIEELKQIPGYENFQFTLTDYNGRTWNNKNAGL